MSASDLHITSLARGQHGVVAARQLREIGVSRTVVRDRVADGRLRRVHRGVYAIGPLTQRATWMAAVLAVGPPAVASHGVAAALHGVRTANRSPVHVTVPDAHAPAGASQSTRRPSCCRAIARRSTASPSRRSPAAPSSSREAFERDHARLARLKLAGYEVMALTWRQVTEEPAWVAGAIQSMLGRSALEGVSRGPADPGSADRRRARVL